MNPDLPVAGLDRRAYRTRKFGSWQRSQALDAQVAAAAQPDGLVFRHELMARTPNTFAAHRLIWLAGQEGGQGTLVEAFFVAYFQEGRDIGDPSILIDLAASAGLAESRASAMLASEEGVAEVTAELERARGLEVAGVPTVLVDGRVLFSGAIPSEHMETHLRRAARHARS